MTPGEPSRRGPGRPPGSTDLRGRLIRAAQEILREPDTPLGMREVAERVGKSRSVPYSVFGKEEEGGGLLALRIAVAAEGAREMHARMAEAAEGRDDPVEALRAVARAFLEFVAENRRLFRLMYGPDLEGLAKLGEAGFRDHPEFRRLLLHRDRAGGVVETILLEAQEAELLAPEIPASGEDAAAHIETPRFRYLQIVWATMIGVAALREDELLRVVGWDLSVELGARLVVESVFGLDPGAVGPVAESFLASASAEPGRTPDVDVDPTGPIRLAEPVHLFDLDIPWRGPRRRELRSTVSPMARRPEPPKPPETPVTRESWGSAAETLRSNPGLRRAAAATRLLARAWILWIDDHPEWIRHHVDTLQKLGARVTVARSTAEAEALLRAQALVGGGGAGYRLILSDIARGGRPDEGVRALASIRALAPDTPVIFFIADIRPELGTPPGAFGITNRVDELLHLVVDALEGR